MGIIVRAYRHLFKTQEFSTYNENSNPDPINFNDLYYRTGVVTINIQSEQLRYRGGLSYNYDQNHFLRYYKYGKSELKKFYDNHQPKSIFEQHFIPKEGNVNQRQLPWVQLIKDQQIGEHGLNYKEGHQAWGPVTSKKLNLEVRRLNKCLNSIKKQGYLIQEGFPRGYFLVKSNEDWVFHIVGGKHRVATLIHLGWNIIPVSIEINWPLLIHQNNLDEWPGVVNGTYSKSEALEIFNAYFNNSKIKL